MKKLKLISLGLLVASLSLAAGRIQNEDVKSSAELRASVLTTTGNLTSGNACITSLGSTAGLATGHFIYDTTVPANISSGTTIAGLPGICAAGQVQMSTTANGNATGDTITFGGQDSQLPNDTKVWVTANGLNKTLFAAVTAGNFAGSPTFTASTKTANYTLVAGDAVAADASAGSFTLTLPDATTNAGRLIFVVRKDASVLYNVTIAAAGGDTFNPTSDTSLVITSQNVSVSLISIGTIWYQF